METAPTGTRENGPYDMWDKCFKESRKIILEYEFPDKPEGQRGRISTPRKVNEKGELEFSRLPEIYAKIVRTPTFLKWFGNWTQSDKGNVSKVVYEDTNEPKIVRHVTAKNIPEEEGLQPKVGVNHSGREVIHFSDNYGRDMSRYYGDTNFYSFVKIINLGVNTDWQQTDSGDQSDGVTYQIAKNNTYVVRKSENVMQIPSPNRNSY